MVNIAICDDSANFIDIIQHKIEHCLKNKFEMECSIQAFGTLDEFKDYIENNKVDIAFLDIMIDAENAMDWSINYLNNSYIQLIFMTSFPQCAYNISETNCCYYIMKSELTEERLTSALRRALQNTTKKDPNLTIVKLRSKNIIVNYQDIIYVETFNNNLVLNMKNSEKIQIYSRLKDYAKELPPNFLQCHKSYMVNMNYISSYEPYKFQLITGKELPIPSKRYNEIIKTYTNYLKNI